MDFFNVKRGSHELLTSLVQFKGVRRRCQSAEPTAHQAALFFQVIRRTGNQVTAYVYISDAWYAVGSADNTL